MRATDRQVRSSLSVPPMRVRAQYVFCVKNLWIAIFLFVGAAECAVPLRYAKGIWARAGGGIGYDISTAVAADAHGNTYVGGLSSPFGQLFGVSFNGYGTTDGFLGKLKPDGSTDWVKQFGGTDFDNLTDIAIVGDSVVVTGTFTGTATIGTTNLVGSAGANGYLACFLLDGTLTWARSIRGDFVQPSGLCTDSKGNLYVAGRAFSLSRTEGISTPFNGGTDAFVIKYSRDGRPLWSFSFGGSEHDVANAVCTEANDNIVVAGYFEKQARFGTELVTALGRRDAFVFKLASDGLPIWIRRI